MKALPPCVVRLLLAASILACSWAPLSAAPADAAQRKPNIVLILADDLGWGDLACYGGKIPTPHCDRLAKEGLRFTDFHTTSSVCTPTRYSILTGRYNWRSTLKQGVLNGWSDPLIPASRQTVATMMRDHGFATACIGKWHLGLDWKKRSKLDSDKSDSPKHGPDFTKPVGAGPLTLGFDHFYGISASLDMPPFVFIDGENLVGIPSVKKTYLREGLAAPDFRGEDCPRVWAEKATTFIAAQSTAKKPFFLYVPLTCPHTPILPTPEFAGKSITPYADFVIQTDWVVGQILAALEKSGVAGDTMVIFTSDNGCSPAAGIPALQKHGHEPNGPWRGTKADIWEGGHRVPLLARWPGKIPAGATTDALACTVDFLATFAEAVGTKPAPAAAEDSQSFLSTLLTGKGGRTTLVSHSIGGEFAVRQGQWKLCLTPGSGGWSHPKPPESWPKAQPENLESLVQLYDLSADPGEKQNLTAKYPDKVKGLVKLMAEFVKSGRSVPGPPAKNDSPVIFRDKLLRAFPDLTN